jgi:hypothetical protein
MTKRGISFVAVLVVLIAVFIIIYVLVMPPCEKCRLLNNGDCNELCDGNEGMVFFEYHYEDCLIGINSTFDEPDEFFSKEWITKELEEKEVEIREGENYNSLPHIVREEYLGNSLTAYEQIILDSRDEYIIDYQNACYSAYGNLNKGENMNCYSYCKNIEGAFRYLPMIINDTLECVCLDNDGSEIELTVLERIPN